MTTPHPDPSCPAAFLDRDGTIIVERHYLSDPDGVELLPHAAEAIRLLNERGYWVLGVSNQSGVGRGFFTTKSVEAVNNRVIELLAAEGAYLNRIYYCPHYKDSADVPECGCRKPAPGLIHQIMHEYPVDLSRSFVAGDRVSDIALARAVGITGALVLTGYGQTERTRFPEGTQPDLVEEDLLAVVHALGKA